MFAEHQPQLSRLGRSSPEGFERIVTFALLTIRQPLRIACMDYRLVRGGDTRPLFGSKIRGYDYLRHHASEIRERCECAYETLDDEDAENVILHALCDIPGIGPANAGFICQMIYGLSGCIDTHNLARFRLTERTFRGREAKYSAKRFAQVIRDYNAFCRRVGGTAALWDGWCEYVSARDPYNYATPDFVSSLHLVPLER